MLLLPYYHDFTPLSAQSQPHPVIFPPQPSFLNLKSSLFSPLLPFQTSVAACSGGQGSAPYRNHTAPLEGALNLGAQLSVATPYSLTPPHPTHQK